MPKYALKILGILLLLSAVVHGQTAQIYQDFTPWTGTVSPDGIWRIAGTWVGSGGNTLDPALAQLTSTYPGETSSGFLSLNVAANQLRGSEIQTLTTPGYSYGYYETRMKVSSVPGVVASFFWIEAPSYGPHEWDIEFLTNESWITSTNSGKVHLTIHPSEKAYILNLPFNPSLAFHKYGFLWTAGQIVFTVDGQAAYTFTDSSLNTTAQGFIMMNSWTGNADWGGGPPTQQATTVYDSVTFYPNATAIPGPFAEWKTAWFGANAPATQTGDSSVNNAAGITNLMAYGLGLNPFTAQQSALPGIGTTTVSGSKYLTLSFTRNTAATDITYAVEGTSNLANPTGWTALNTFSSGAWSPSSNITESGSGSSVNVKAQDTQSTSAASSRYLRLRVTH